MKIINTHEAKTHFSSLLSVVNRGREVIIGKHGTPVAKLVPFRKHTKKRPSGQLKGRIRIAKDFDSLPKSFLKHFKHQ